MGNEIILMEGFSFNALTAILFPSVNRGLSGQNCLSVLFSAIASLMECNACSPRSNRHYVFVVYRNTRDLRDSAI